MKEVLLLKCGEIVLKGLNRKTFEDRLLKNLKRRMAHVADCEITMRQSVVYVEIPGRCGRRCGYGVRKPCVRLCGPISRASGLPRKRRTESVIATAKDYLAPNLVAAAKTFKVESKRADKTFPMTSIRDLPARRRRAASSLFPMCVAGHARSRPRPCTSKCATKCGLCPRGSGCRGRGRHAHRLERPCGAAALRRHRLARCRPA